MPRFRHELRRAPLFRAGDAAGERASEAPETSDDSIETIDLSAAPALPWRVLMALFVLLGLRIPWLWALAWGLEVGRRRYERRIHQLQLQAALEEAESLRRLAQKLAARELARQRHEQPEDN